MNALLRLALILVFPLVSHAAARSAADKSSEAEVTRVDAARVDALLRGDVTALEKIFADDLAYIHSGGKVDTKEKYLASLRAGSLTYVSLRYDPPAVVRAVGRDTVIVTGKATIEAKNKAGQPMKRILTTTTVYVRSAGGWQVVSYQGTPVQP